MVGCEKRRREGDGAKRCGGGCDPKGLLQLPRKRHLMGGLGEEEGMVGCQESEGMGEGRERKKVRFLGACEMEEDGEGPGWEHARRRKEGESCGVIIKCFP